MTDIDTLKSEFNDLCCTLVSNLIIIDSSFKIYQDFIIDIQKSKSAAAIDIFVLNILKYQDQIRAGDENFFLGRSYDDVNVDVPNKIKADKIFEFKNIWTKLSPENKHCIRQYLALMCDIGNSYLDLIQVQRSVSRK